MLNWKKRQVGDWCWLYDGHMKERRYVKVLEVIERERHGFFMEYYIVEASCHIDCFPMFASQAQLRDSKE
jgi:hypothetical protein